MNNPNGLTIDSNDHLWVAETDFQPKRVSVWTLDGKRVNAFYGPAEYGGGGTLDPRDKTRFYYHGMELKLDWDKGTSEVARVLFRPGPKDLQLPGGHDAGQPETPLYVHGKRYFTNCYNSNPTNGAGVAFLWQDRDGVAVPVAALGRANDWDLLKTDAFKWLWPKGVNLKGDYWANQAMFVWTDLNGDGKAQPDEVTLVKKSARGITVMPDLSYLASYVDGAAVRYAPKRFTDDRRARVRPRRGRAARPRGAGRDLFGRRAGAACRQRLGGADGGAEAVRAAVDRRCVPGRGEVVLSELVAGLARLARIASAGGSR